MTLSDSEKILCPLCSEESTYCGQCGNCEECDFLATEEGFNCHIMNDHEPKDVFQHFGIVWIRDHMKYINRNLDYAQDRYHIQKWDGFLAACI